MSKASSNLQVVVSGSDERNEWVEVGSQEEGDKLREKREAEWVREGYKPDWFSPGRFVKGWDWRRAVVCRVIGGVE